MQGFSIAEEEYIHKYSTKDNWKTSTELAKELGCTGKKILNLRSRRFFQGFSQRQNIERIRQLGLESRTATIPTFCSICGVKFFASPSRKQKCCSLKCYLESIKSRKKCPVCGEIIKKEGKKGWYSSSHRTFCSNECKRLFSIPLRARKDEFLLEYKKGKTDIQLGKCFNCSPSTARTVRIEMGLKSNYNKYEWKNLHTRGLKGKGIFQFIRQSYPNILNEYEKWRKTPETKRFK